MNAIRCTAAVVGVGVLVLMMAGVGVAQSAATLTAAKPESLAVGNKMYDAEKELARLAKRYGLTADQKTKIQPILLGQQKRVHALGEDEALSDAEWAGEVRKVHLQTVAEVKRQLTDEQATKYAKDEAKRVKSIDSGSNDGDDGPPNGPPPDGGPGGGGPGGGGPGGGGPPGE